MTRVPCTSRARSVMVALAATLALLFGLSPRSPATPGPRGPRQAASVLPSSAPPPPCPTGWVGLLGRYGDETGPLVREKDGRLEVLPRGGGLEPLEHVEADVFRSAGGRLVRFSRDESGRAAQLVLDGAPLPRRTTGTDGAVFRIAPRRPVAQVRREALAAEPPVETGPFRAVDLVDVASLDPAIRLDIRYATSDNFLGVSVYETPRAFLQRPAAESLLAAHRAVGAHGYGLLIHDAYRPWWVTKLFWEATPPAKREFVADPARGSRHNRGCAVDLTLYRLADGSPVEMPGVYDEMSERSYPDYPGGTSLQRWHRALLRAAMEGEGFTVFESEWWHFDYRGWREYPILNIPVGAIAP